MDRPGRIQVHVPMPYKQQPRENPRVRGYLDRGYRIVNLQRLSDREAIVTLEAGSLSGSGTDGFR